MSASADLRLVPLILSLGLDTFALSVAIGSAPLSLRTRLRLALTFALAEGLMPAAGLLIGQPLGSSLGRLAPFTAGTLLIGTGLWILCEALNDSEHATTITATSAHSVAFLGIAISASLDELAMGFSFGVLHVPAVPALAAIALQALIVSFLGQWAGQRIDAAIGEWAEGIAGVILCVLGAWFIGAPLVRALG